MSGELRKTKKENRSKDLTGLKIHLLTVKGLSTTKNSRKGRFWLCACICGKETNSFNTGDLLSGKVLSCGCYGQKRKHKPSGEASWNALLLKHKSACKRNDRVSVFIENLPLFKELCSLPCVYCGSDPKPWSPYSTPHWISTLSKDVRARSWIKTNNIDRIDNDLGYLLNNSISCCTNCNFMKGRMNFWNFINHLDLFQPGYADRIVHKLTGQVKTLPPKPEGLL